VFPALLRPFQPSGFSAGGRVEATLSITGGTKKNAKPINGKNLTRLTAIVASGDESFGVGGKQKKWNFSFTQKNSKSISDKLFSDSSIFTSIQCTRCTKSVAHPKTNILFFIPSI
jgi:hypothetical protein